MRRRSFTSKSLSAATSVAIAPRVAAEQMPSAPKSIDKVSSLRDWHKTAHLHFASSASDTSSVHSSSSSDEEADSDDGRRTTASKAHMENK